MDSDDPPATAKEQVEPEWALVPEWPPDLSLAEPGQRGRLIGVVSHEGNSLLRLVLSVAPDVMILLPTTIDQAHQLLDAFVLQDVEVIESEASTYGFHNLRLVTDDPPSTTTI